MAVPSSNFIDNQFVQIQAKINDSRLGVTSEIVLNASVDSHLIQRSPLGQTQQWMALAYTAAALGVYRHVVRAWTPQAESNITVTDRQMQPQMYNQLKQAIDELASLDEEESQFIDEEAHREGLRLLKLMNMTNVPPPSLFSHGGDSLVFTWQLGHTKRYLTPLDGIARIREYEDNTHGQASSSLNFDLADQLQTVKLLKYVGGSEWTAAKS